MLQIILLVFGIYYLIRRLKMKDVSIKLYPNADTDAFNKWKSLETQSCDYFIAASWGVAFLGIIVGFAMVSFGFEGELAPSVALFSLFLVLLVTSAIKGSKAAKIRKENRFFLPKVFG